MVTSAECRTQVEACMNEAQGEDHVGVRTALLDMAGGWATVAFQMDRLHNLRAEQGLGRLPHSL
jgi:hypothetical protein